MKLLCKYINNYRERGLKYLYSINMFSYLFPEYNGRVLIVESSRIQACVQYDSKGHSHYTTEDALLYAFEQDYKSFESIHFLMSTSLIDEKWCVPTFKKYLHKEDNVCVLALSFFEDTKNLSDWNKLYSKTHGIFYKENTNVFFRYGINNNQIHWVNYFQDNRMDILNKILNSNVILLPGGAPDMMMKRIKELKLKKILKNYQGIIIGCSAGAMIQLNEYHITPDRDYPEFKYLQGLGYLNSFMIEVHYRGSNPQRRSIEKVMEEKHKKIYAIYEDGGLCVRQNQVEMFGHIEEF